MKFLFVICALSFLLLLGASQNVSAGHFGVCNESGYNGAGDCQSEAIYGDLGGSELQSCQYRVVSNGEETVGWTNATEGICSGSQATLWTGQITINSTGNCNDEGVAKCLVYAKAKDNGGNETTTQIATLDIDYSLPVVNATNASSQWFTSRTTNLSASDTGGSGLVEARYNWDSNAMNSSCTSGGTTYTNGAVLTVAQGSHRLYLCARDNAGNVGNWDSNPDQYRVDPIAPVYQSFLVNGVSCSSNGPVFCPATVTATGTINFTWGASDTGGSGVQNHELWRARDAAENGGNWVWQNIQPNIPPTTFSTTDTPQSSGTWWYGMHTRDNALHTDNSYNCITEGGEHICGGVSSDSLDPRTARGPVKVLYGDQDFPTVSSFIVSPRPPSWVNSINPNVSVTWTVADNGGSYLKEVTVLRCDKPVVSQCGEGDWIIVKVTPAPPNSNSWSGSLSPQDTPPEGTSWYGIHVWDNAGHRTVEPATGGLDVKIDKTAPGAPTLVTPINNITITSSRPTFDWNDVTGDFSGISSYNIRANNTPNFNNLEIDANTGNSFYASTVDLGEGNQYWWVRATDGAGNQGGDSNRGDYQIQLNQPPNASFNCTPSNCTIFSSEILTFNNNSSDPDGSGDITLSEWDILSYGSAPDASCQGKCNHTLQPIAPNTYTMHLRVQDSSGASDTDQKNFTVKQDIVAGFMCSLDNVNFVACSSLSGQISQGEALYLKDDSSLSEHTIVSEGASSVTSRTWKINGSGFGSGPNDANPSTTIPTQGTVTLELDARDNQGRSDTQTHTLNPQLPFPEFQEISPF